MPLLPQTFNPFTDGFYETGDQVHRWVLDRARRQAEIDRQRRAALRTREDVDRYRAEVRTASPICRAWRPYGLSAHLRP